MVLDDYIEIVPGRAVSYSVDLLGGYHWWLWGGFGHGEGEPFCLGSAL